MRRVGLSLCAVIAACSASGGSPPATDASADLSTVDHPVVADTASPPPDSERDASGVDATQDSLTAPDIVTPDIVTPADAMTDAMTLDDTVRPSDVAPPMDVVAADSPTPLDAATDTVVPADVVAPTDSAPPRDGAVGCRSSTECPAAARVCDTSRSVCVECVSNADCGAGQSCSPANTCRVACTPGASECADIRTVRACVADGSGYSLTTCTAGPGATVRCDAGRCVTTCDASRADCDRNPANGCETDLASVSNCGACGVACATPNATAACLSGACAIGTCNAGFADCNGRAADGCETEITSNLHCGSCSVTCTGDTGCVSGVCVRPAAASCLLIHSTMPSAPTGIYEIDPDGTGPATPFNAYCAMSLLGGGWTLAAVFTNADADHWSPLSPVWVDSSAFGDATVTTGLTDAKSRAFNEVGASDFIIVRAGSTISIEMQTVLSCLGGRSLRTLFSVDSSNASSCAHRCSVSTVGPPWTGGLASCEDSSYVHFRCRDASATTTVGGFAVSTVSNSFITMLYNGSSCSRYNSGAGVSNTTGSADFDSDFTAAISRADTAGRLLFVR